MLRPNASFTGHCARPRRVWRGDPQPTYLATLTFGTLGNETVFTMRAEFESAADLAVSIKGGWAAGTNQALDKLERHLATY